MNMCDFLKFLLYNKPLFWLVTRCMALTYLRGVLEYMELQVRIIFFFKKKLMDGENVN